MGKDKDEYDSFFRIKNRKEIQTIEKEKEEVEETFEDLTKLSTLIQILIPIFVSLILIYPLLELIDAVSYLILTSFFGNPIWIYTFFDFALLMITMGISILSIILIYKIANWYYNRKLEE